MGFLIYKENILRIIVENKEIHFFDLDNTLWYLDSKIWVVDKRKPNIPIIKLSKHDMFMIQNVG